MIPKISNFSIILNARSLHEFKIDTLPNWEVAKYMFNVGADSSIKICEDCGIDPYSHYVKKV